MAVQGFDQAVTVVFYEHTGGPPVDPDTVGLTITHNGTDVLGDLVYPDDVSRDSEGHYRYVWAVPVDQELGTYLATWSAVLPGASSPTLGYDTFTVTDPGSGDWVSLDSFRDSLANAGGAGSRTAAELPVDRLLLHLENAHSRVRGRLYAYTIPSPLDDAPDLLRAIVIDVAAYFATLEWNGSQPLEDRDPINLRYQAALADLKALAAGTIRVPGVDPTSGQPSGDPESYTQIPDVGLAAGWARDTASVEPGYWHGMSQGF